MKLLFETIWNALILLSKTLLAIIPLYNALSSFKQNLIATALGISPVVIVIIKTIVKTLKNDLRMK